MFLSEHIYGGGMKFRHKENMDDGKCRVVPLAKIGLIKTGLLYCCIVVFLYSFIGLLLYFCIVHWCIGVLLYCCISVLVY